jgi:hypothetical protein
MRVPEKEKENRAEEDRLSPILWKGPRHGC